MTKPFSVFCFFVFSSCLQLAHAQTPEPSAVVPSESAPAREGLQKPEGLEEEYEVDYEEEPEETSDEEPEPTQKPKNSAVKESKTAPQKSGGGPAVQGSRALHRFTPVMKTEVNSVYQKNGKRLNVDTD